MNDMNACFSQDDSLGDFLADIMMPISPTNLAPSVYSTGGLTGTRDVLDFGIYDNFELNDTDLGQLNRYNMSLALQPEPQCNEDISYPPSRGEESHQPALSKLTTEAFQRSLWRWHPEKADHGQVENMNLHLPIDVGVVAAHRPCKERLAQPARDKIMAMLFSACDPAVISKIITQFPSVEILDSLMQQCLYLHSSRSDSWIHVPTFQTNSVKPELLAIVIATGAVNSPIPVIRKLGFALQEATRLSIPKTVILSFLAHTTMKTNRRIVRGRQ